MQITINGNSHDLDSQKSLTELLDAFNIDSKQVAVEHNLEIVPRSRYDTVKVNDGDKIELVEFVGGG